MQRRPGSNPPGNRSARRAPRPDPEPTPESRRLARRDRRRADRREAILAAARDVLVQHGLAGLTTAEVARAADVSKPAVYYYFDSKEALVGALAVQLLEAEVEALLAAIDAAPTGIEALAALVETKVDRYAGDLDAFRIAYVWPQLLGLPQTLLEESVYPLSTRVNDRLAKRLLSEGELHPSLDPRRLANLAWITAHGILSLAASLDHAGGATSAPLSLLRDEACRLLRRAAKEPTTPQKSRVRKPRGAAAR